MHSAPIALIATHNRFVEAPRKTNKMIAQTGMPNTWQQVADERKEAIVSASERTSSTSTSTTTSSASSAVSKHSKMSKLKAIFKHDSEQQTSQQTKHVPTWKTILNGDVYKHHPMYRLEKHLEAQMHYNSY